MSYSYKTEKAYTFTEKGQVTFLQIRDHVHRILAIAGCISMGKAMMGAHGGGGSWEFMACVDRLVELGEIREVLHGEYAGQHRIFVSMKENT